MPPPYRAAIVTVSDTVSEGTREDQSGPAVRRLLEEAGWTVKSTEVIPDDFGLIRERLAALAADSEVDVVFTTGGTGVAPRDRTPDATTSIMERSLPGVAEVMRREGYKKTPLAALSRGVVGVKGKVLLVNLPGSPEGAADSLQAVVGILPHAIDVVRGELGHAPPTPEPEMPATPSPADVPQEGEPAPVSEPPAPGPEKSTPEEVAEPESKPPEGSAS